MWQAAPLINAASSRAGLCTTAFVIWLLPQSRQAWTPKNSARPPGQNWLKSPAKMKTTLCWLLQERKRHPSNKFGLASSMKQVPRISIGLMVRFRPTRTGLQENPMENPRSHAAACGQDKHLLSVSEHQDPGMTRLVQ